MLKVYQSVVPITLNKLHSRVKSKVTLFSCNPMS